MKVILNKDLANLGEEGDVKDVAKGYFRNYLFPRGIALPYNESTIKLFESRKEEIAARKEEKSKAALSDKEKLEQVELVLTMQAGGNGKLYGAVTNQTVADELLKLGFRIERKRIELPGNTFKSVGKYKISVRLYEGMIAEIPLTVQAQVIKPPETKSTTERGRRQRRTSAQTTKPTPVTEAAPQVATPDHAT
ncbi:MAG: 50S ribosomal protein L9 [Treponema sp.]|jgi:large subunit ribosomal protein L9|nr:50S ribosomal protein L9 [Treponema sp.]